MRRALAGIVVLGLAAGCATTTTVPRLVGCRALLLRDGADPALDRPAHVRAASGLAQVGDRLAIAEDDARFIGMVGPAGVDALALPPGPDGRRLHDDTRGTKALKLDLESIVEVPDADGRTRLLAFGSGSTAAREVVAVVSADGAPRVIDASALFALLRAEPGPDHRASAGHGGRPLGDRQRQQLAVDHGGVGEAVPRAADLAEVVAGDREGARWWGTAVEVGEELCDLEVRGGVHRLEPVAGSPVAALEQAEPGADHRGARYGFTDATVIDGELLALAVAERSPDVTRDGAVVGARLGRWDGATFTWSTIVEADGQPTVRKLEGIAPDRARPGDLVVVVDPDDPGRPSTMCGLRVGGHA